MTDVLHSTTRRSRQRYPELQLIATAPVKSVTPDVLDEHFYMSAEKSLADASHYDKADRNGPKIFVGEWATREGEPTPNLQAALGDAAWMTGMERNSDMVIMSSYAPLFVNVNPGGMQWATDLIGYDALYELRLAQLLGAGALWQPSGHGGSACDAGQLRARVSTPR